MKHSITTYIAISVVSFLMLSAVQFYLVYNTYELKNERYYFAEKTAINEWYSRLVRNDKLYPGGQQIVDSFINKNLYHLDSLYKSNRNEFTLFSQKMIDSMVAALRKEESIAGFLSQFKNDKNFPDSLEYALNISYIGLLFSDTPYVNMYTKNVQYKDIDPAVQKDYGLHIGGTLQKLNKQNLASEITVSSPASYSYRMTFGLHVEPVGRQLAILKQMGLILALSLFSVLIMVLLFYVTFKNWMKQKKLSEMKSDFINNITHEFHTPLSAIIVANKSLQNEKIIEKKENINSLTSIIQRQSDRLKTLIGQVLDIVTANKINLRKEPHSVHNLLDEILLDYRLNLANENKSITLSFNKGAVKDNVELDQFYFTTMMLNILDNAVRYNNSEVKEINVFTLNDDEHLQIIIKDNGIGMKPEIIKHIFEKFYRSPNGMSNQTKGLGLGLFYVKQGVEAHDWQINVDSKPGDGSVFTIKIPFEN